MKYITLSTGIKTIVDDEDYEKFGNINWQSRPKRSGIYAARTIRYGNRKDNKKRSIYLHRLIVDAKLEDFVDHINRDTLDNRKSNLRIVTRSENFLNAGKFRRKTSSKYKGVSFDKNRNKWLAYNNFIVNNKLGIRYINNIED